jgi:hypothetical protein
MSTAGELRDFAQSCHMMGLAMNNPKWHSLAERVLQRASCRTVGSSDEGEHLRRVIATQPVSHPTS